MYPPLIPLLVLQDRDLKLFHLKAQLTQIPQEASKLKSQLNEKMQAVVQAKHDQMEVEKKVRAVELEVETRKNTIDKLKTRQAETKKNDEYQMLIHEIKRYGIEVEELETKELGLLEELDQKTQQRGAQQAALEGAKEHVTQNSQALAEKKKILTKTLREVEADRDILAQRVEPELLSLYHRILSRRGAGAVAEVSPSGQCLGCNIKLPAAAFYRLQAGESLIQCDECSRILYYA